MGEQLVLLGAAEIIPRTKELIIFTEVIKSLD